MFGSPQSALSTYARIGVETGVDAANPHQLIVMLFDGAIAATVHAAREIQAGNVAAKGQSISKAIMIIESGLRASLNKNIGGAIALNLDALYEYMSNRLLLANLNNDSVILDEVRQLLIDLKEAWENIAAVPMSSAANGAANNAGASKSTNSVAALGAGRA